MTPTGYSTYKHAAINTEHSKEKLLLMLYEGAVKFVRFARRGIEEKDAKIRGENISKVLAILTELDCALDREGGGELVENLSDLYGYMIDRLTHANVKNDPEALGEVEGLLTKLKEGFEGAAAALRTPQEDLKEAPAEPKIEESEMQGGICIAI